MTHLKNRINHAMVAFATITVWLLSLWSMPGTASAQIESPVHGRNPAAVRGPNVGNVYPYRAVAKIIARFRDGAEVPSTGVFVSANIVFTAAHNVYRSRRGGMAVELEIMPAYNGEAPYGTTGAKQIEIDPEYINTGNISYDFAAILTTSCIGKSSGWLGYQVPSNDVGPISIIGYPDDNKYDGNSMYESRGTAYLAYGNKLVYDATTYEGMSGSPIISRAGGHFSVIGVHNSGGAEIGRKGEVNLGAGFFNTILRRFPEWERCQ